MALDLLARTERCASDGGMVVEETGKPRTKGGIFVKLLKEATNLDLEQQARAIERVKRDGLAAKKARVERAVKRAKRKAVEGRRARMDSIGQLPRGAAAVRRAWG